MAATQAARWRLDGRTAIVTGGSKGLGAAIVEELLGLGATVLFTARGSEDLDKMLERLAPTYGADKVLCCAADVSTADGRASLVERATALFGGALDILVNNVGTNIRRPVEEATEAEYDTMVATNQTSAFFLCKLCLPLLRKSAAASVVNVASAAGIRSSGTGVIYAATKAAMTHMSEALACEWAGHNIRVNCVAPWMVLTPLLEVPPPRTAHAPRATLAAPRRCIRGARAIADDAPLRARAPQAAVANDPTALDAVRAGTPLGRLGEPADTAGAVAFLCMPAAKYITGQVRARRRTHGTPPIALSDPPRRGLVASSRHEYMLMTC